ncbi:helix-turn-helix domain-containing protein [Neisseria subflava]|uniref:helix-turn-helix domain-containing protein n=1 Tax=Neisseria subflava TaxID=28449 RepID=UPI00280B0C85|nr:helix-turn-helix domain-containing protein [Neisseria subflava]
MRHFSQATGMNFGEWLTTERLWQVQVLLENTDLPIERIAEQSGFGSLYFSDGLNR